MFCNRSEYGKIQCDLLLTVHGMPVFVVFRVTVLSPSHAMPIQEIFPFPHFADLLLAMLVFFIIVRPARVIDVVPILRHWSSFLVLLALLPTPASALLSVEVVDVLVI